MLFEKEEMFFINKYNFKEKTTKTILQTIIQSMVFLRWVLKSEWIPKSKCTDLEEKHSSPVVLRGIVQAVLWS